MEECKGGDLLDTIVDGEHSWVSGGRVRLFGVCWMLLRICLIGILFIVI